MKALKVLKYVGFGILGVGFVILTVFVTMSLWNTLIPLCSMDLYSPSGRQPELFILSKILLTGVAPADHITGAGEIGEENIMINSDQGAWKPKRQIRQNRCR